MSAEEFRQALNACLKLGVVAVAVGLLYVFLRRRYSFEVRIDDHQLRVTRGVLPANIRDDIQTAFAQAGLAHGWIGGRRRGRLTLLDFSVNIPPDVRQRLRNLANFVK